MRHQFALILALLSLPAFAGQPYELKGIAVGSHVVPSALKAALGVDCTGNYCSGGQTQLAGTWCDTLVSQGDDGGIDSITAFFPVLSFESIAEAFTTKYGKPAKISRARMSTVGGVQLLNVNEVWRNAAGDQIDITKYADGTQGIVMLRTKAKVAEDDAKAAKDQNDI